jgi:DNA-binding CsgD family transcriptional regulator
MLFRAHGLTTRERAVASFLAAGHSNESIAAQLELRVHTVKDHVKAIFAKTRSAGRVEFVTRFA